MVEKKVLEHLIDYLVDNRFDTFSHVLYYIQRPIVNTQITKKSSGEYSWFLIDAVLVDKCRSTYKFQGTILSGISSYIKVIKHFKRIENENKS